MQDRQCCGRLLLRGILQGTLQSSQETVRGVEYRLRPQALIYHYFQRKQLYSGTDVSLHGIYFSVFIKSLHHSFQIKSHNLICNGRDLGSCRM
jgi:hypothetical protein